jgi:hypothetical protein
LRGTRNILDAITLLYTGYISPQITPSQWKKFISSVERDPGPDLFIPFLREAVSEIVLPEYPRLTYRDYSFSGTVRVPSSDGSAVLNNVEALADDFGCSCILDILDHDACEYVISDVLDDLYPALQQEVKVEVDDPYVGRIGVIQERGLKARFVAVPKLILQLGLRPLGKYLYKILSDRPWDCTYNQKSGVDWARSELKRNRRLYSVDISDASNNMPFGSTLRVLHWLQCPWQDLELFQQCARGEWLIPKYIRDQLRAQDVIIRTAWTQGQPLGLYPSFPAFALWHGLVLRSLELRYKLENTFRVLGDDVVISNPLIHWAYRTLMDRLTVPVSLTKTFTGIKAGEFAGFVITRESAFLARKAIIPTKDNLCYRAFLRTGGDPERISSVDELVSFAHYTTQQTFEGSAGVPLELRSAIGRVLSDGSNDVTVIAGYESSKRLYNRLCSVFKRQDSDKVLSLSELDLDFFQKWKGLNCGILAKEYPMGVLAMTLLTTKVGETILPKGMEEEFYRCLKRVQLEREIDRDPLRSLCSAFDEKIKYSVLKRWKKQAFIKQLGDFKKSKSIVQQEIADVLLSILVGE